jgi:hypothetical protein
LEAGLFDDQAFPSPASLPLPSSPASPVEAFKASADPSLTLAGFCASRGLNLEQCLAEGKLLDLLEKSAQPKPPSPPVALHKNAILFADVPRRTDLDFVTTRPARYHPARAPPVGLDRDTVALVPKQAVFRQSTLTSAPVSPSKRLRNGSATTPPSPSSRKKPNPASARNSSTHPTKGS